MCLSFELVFENICHQSISISQFLLKLMKRHLCTVNSFCLRRDDTSKKKTIKLSDMNKKLFLWINWHKYAKKCIESFVSLYITQMFVRNAKTCYIFRFNWFLRQHFEHHFHFLNELSVNMLTRGTVVIGAFNCELVWFITRGRLYRLFFNAFLLLLMIMHIDLVDVVICCLSWCNATMWYCSLPCFIWLNLGF